MNSGNKMCYGIIIVVIIVIAGFVLFSMSNNKPPEVPEDAVVIVGSNNSYLSMVNIELHSSQEKIVDKEDSFHVTYHYGDTESEEKLTVGVNFDKISFKENGTNPYSTSYQTALDELFERAPDVSEELYGEIAVIPEFTLDGSSSDEVLSSLNIEDLSIAYYDENGTYFHTDKLNDGNLTLSDNSLEYVYNTEEGYYYSSHYGSGDKGYAELYMLLKSNESSSEDYYYEFIIPLMINTQESSNSEWIR